ncbi:MAG: FkbM family methyltransferase [Anaerolineae bacterium]|nr:FkbM family methyltransferase [Gemmatimonadaceae bacterium]
MKEPFRARLFGYRASARPFDVRFSRNLDGVDLADIDGAFRLCVSPKALSDIRFHFQENGEAVEEMRALIRIAREIGGVFFDVGAFHGIFALIFCSLREENTAFCFEPSKPALEEAARLRQLNGLEDRIEFMEVGIGRDSHEAAAWVDDLGFARFEQLPELQSSRTVQVTTLDDVITNGAPIPSVIKIDVEGAEHEVLLGARELLARHHPVLMLELHLDIMERRSQPPCETVNMLTSLGYRFQDLAGKEMRARDTYDVPLAIHRVIAV